MNISWKHHEGGGGIEVKTFWKQSLQGQEGKKTFHEMKKVYIEITILILFSLKVPRKCIPILLEKAICHIDRKTFFPVPTP